MELQRITITGAGPGGLAMALYLRRHGKEVLIYALSGGAIMLSPDALETLETHGVFDHIKSKCYCFMDLTFRDNDQKYLDNHEIGNSERFGHGALRVYRQAAIDELKAMVDEAGFGGIY